MTKFPKTIQENAKVQKPVFLNQGFTIGLQVIRNVELKCEDGGRVEGDGSS